MNLLSYLKKLKYQSLEIIFLSLTILSLPSFEAPKNIFLILFIFVALYREIRTKNSKKWDYWDSIFFSIILSAFLSTIFAGLSPGDEWKGFRTLLTFIGLGWLVSRSRYSEKEFSWIFWLTLLSALPPLFWGFTEYFVFNSRDALQLHSVGHVNHSAIYLTMIFGASFGTFLALQDAISFFKKIILAILVLILFFSLIVGMSRAAFGVSLLISSTLLWLFRNKKGISFVIFAVMGIILWAMVAFHAPIFEKQIRNQQSHNVLAGRGVIWNTTIEAARLYPLFGIGIDNRAFVTEEIIKNSLKSRNKNFNASEYDFHFKHSHSFYLTNIAERGVVGAFITLGFILGWLIYLFKTFGLNKKSVQAGYLWAGSFSAWTATFAIGIVNTTFHHEHGILACLFLGLHIAFVNTHRSKFKKLPAPQ